MKEGWQVSAVTFTPCVQQWLRQTMAVSLLHNFDQAINLIDVNGTIISVVQEAIGAGPFSIVVDDRRPFPTTINPSTPITKTADNLQIGPLRIDLRPAQVWQPQPSWNLLRAQPKAWLTILPELQTAVAYRQDRLVAGSPAHFATQFQTATKAVGEAVAQPDTAGLAAAVAKLAGLGPGLTPAGDDFLVGLLLGLWAARSEEAAIEWGKIVVETAVPRTTQLSAAWLQAAGRGEAGLAWHGLVDSLIEGYGWKLPVRLILAQGATSGIAALLGFLAATSKILSAS